MTNEEAKDYIREWCPYDRQEEIIKALEREPCDDAISRQNAISLADDLKQNLPNDEHIADMVMAHNEGILEYQTQLSLLPPVTPQTKTGRWVDDKCSACGKGIEDLIESSEWYRNESPKYCPFCGIKIQPYKAESEG